MLPWAPTSAERWAGDARVLRVASPHASPAALQRVSARATGCRRDDHTRAAAAGLVGAIIPHRYRVDRDKQAPAASGRLGGPPAASTPELKVPPFAVLGREVAREMLVGEAP